MESSVCFVCKKVLPKQTLKMNRELYLPVCPGCKDSDEEKKAIDDYLESLRGFNMRLYLKKKRPQFPAVPTHSAYIAV